MATIQATVTEAGFPNASKTYTLSDADMDAAIAAFQSAADPIGGTATRNQVLSYMFDLLIKQGIQSAVQASKTIPKSIPPPIQIA